MTDDLLALARDVDWLLRARQEGRLGPSMESYGDGDLKGRRPAVEERRAYDLACKLEGVTMAPERDEARRFEGSADAAVFRTRRHVAMLAVTEPDLFRSCLAAPAGGARVGSIPKPPRVYYVRKRGGGNGCRDGSNGMTAIELGRVAHALERLIERLRLHREADVVAADNERRAREAQDHLESIARTEAALIEDEDVLARMTA